MKYPNLSPAEPGGSGSGKPAASALQIKALCHLEDPYPESFEKHAEKPKISGYGPLANRLECNANWGDFANVSDAFGATARPTEEGRF